MTVIIPFLLVCSMPVTLTACQNGSDGSSPTAESSAVSAATDGTGETVGPTNAEHTAGTTAGTETAASAGTDTEAPVSSDSVGRTTAKATAAAVRTTAQTESAGKNRIDFTDKSPVNLYGRILWSGRAYASVPGFSWTNSGFEVTFEGDRLTAEFGSGQGNQFWNITVDGDRPKLICVSGPGEVTLVRDLGKGIHTVRMEKSSEGYTVQSIISLSTSANGRFYTPSKKPKRRILFIGDSITAGIGTVNETVDGNTCLQDGLKTYEALLSTAFSAESQVLALSGQAVCQRLSENGKTEPGIMREVFTHDNYWINRSAEYDFSWVPDVVVINLGTNDDAARVSESDFLAGVREYVRLVRTHYPKTKIVWAYGIMNYRFRDALEAFIPGLSSEGIGDVYFVPLKYQGAYGGTGYENHPGVKGHQMMATEIAPVIEEITGWRCGSFYG